MSSELPAPSKPSEAGSAHRTLPAPRPLYIHVDGVVDPIFSFLHLPTEATPLATAVLICPPFGWEDICSYRSRRAWAEHLALAGHPALRIDLPGAGDSGGSPSDPDRLAAWTGAVLSAAVELREMTGCDRLAAIGIGLGGLTICTAIAEDAPIDEVVLWATPARGRTLLRELRIFARLQAFPFETAAEAGPAAVSESSIRVGGFLLSQETVQALEELDLTKLALPAGRLDRALLLGREGLPVDPRLSNHLSRAGATVSTAPGVGYGAMMTKPHLARSPTDVFARVLSWLQERLGSTVTRPEGDGLLAARPSRARRSETLELDVAGTPIRERPLTIAQPCGDLFGILTEPVAARLPVDDLCAVLLNAGAIRRIGPSRMWVETARRWAASGVPTLRLDLEGIGDAGGDSDRFTELSELYVPRLVEQVIAALDTLEARGSAQRFVLLGLCSGAYWSFQSALRDERVAAAFMLNPRALFWDPMLEVTRDFRRGVLRVSSWRSVLRGEIPPARFLALARGAPLALPRRAAARRSARRAGDDQLDLAFDSLRDTGRHLQFVFSGNEPLYEELELDGRLQRLGRWPNIDLELIPGEDHTLRPLESQRRASEALDRALEQERRKAVRA
jgi:alpha-beta hydrolase superfamily lysophospholipase